MLEIFKMKRSCCGVRHVCLLYLCLSLDLQPRTVPRREGEEVAEMLGTVALLEMGLSLWDLSPTPSLLQWRWVQEAWKDLGSQHNQHPGEVGSPHPYGATCYLCSAQCWQQSVLSAAVLLWPFTSQGFGDL